MKLLQPHLILSSHYEKDQRGELPMRDAAEDVKSDMFSDGFGNSGLGQNDNAKKKQSGVCIWTVNIVNDTMDSGIEKRNFLGCQAVVEE